MNRVYTGLDIGENTIKIAVMKKTDTDLVLLAKSEVKTSGISKGNIVDAKSASKSIASAIQSINSKLNIEIKKVIISIKSKNVVYKVANSEIKVIDPNMISGKDITNIIKNSVKDNIDDDYELVTAFPVAYKLDGGMVTNNPKGKSSEKLYSKVVLGSVPKKYLIDYLNLVSLCGLEVVDVTLNDVADYYAVRNKEIDKQVGIIVDVGESETSIGLFNKGILIKSSSSPNGSHHVDNDISYIYKIGYKDARKLKETYATASVRYADKYDEIEIKDENGQSEKVSQYKLSEIVEARIGELLNLTKKEIKNLTNRRISYIIILGGLSEMTGFSFLASRLFGEKVTVWSSTTLGMRHNKYGTLIGMIKYFDNKLESRSKKLSMIDNASYDKLSETDNLEMVIRKMLND